ncbi:MAG TPA: transglutaminase domain-containing protein, partial [Solirubrobacteraceae bacterium]|nr:transglutaminase domain-containing protein [Solirubrobacteraceae bacterium]
MSAGAHGIEWRGGPGARAEPRIGAAVRARPWIRLVTFAALAAYGTERWATMLRPAPGWRLVGLVVLAVVLAGGIPLLARFDRVVATVAGFLVTLTVFPIAGLRWEWFVQVRVAMSATAIGNGLARLPDVFVPYVGHNADVRLVMVLGAAVLLLDAAAVLAFAGPAGSRLGDGRRAAVALPLTALAVVPSTLVRPHVPYLQGLVLFALLGAFLWGERVRRQTAASALVVVLAAGIVASLLAPDLDQHTPWINYRAWAGTAAPRRLDSFDWNQTYGPLRWPHSGHEVLTVQSRSGDYWKAQDLDVFTGRAWVQGASPQPALPPPRHSALVRWTQTLHVSIEGMQTRDVIAAGTAGPPSAVPGGVGPGADAGTWVAGRSLGPGTSYTVKTYSPRPTAGQLATAGRRYPAPALAGYLTLTIPQPWLAARLWPSVQFTPFTAGGRPTAIGPRPAGRSAGALLRRSPYARAYALARRLATAAATPYAYVRSVQRYLANGFSYDQNPAVSRYPLETFLFSSRQGYCQQFSGAMALLPRMGGIPARVAAGFTTGSYDASAHRWMVTDTDAHAWVEAWFPRYGWVRFDPTPASAPARGSTAPPILKASAATAAKNAVTARRNAGSGGAGTSGH